MDKPVLFVVGSGRSGTTLLYELICCHPGAAWVSNYSQRIPALGRFHPKVPTAFKEQRTRRWAVRPVEGYRLFDRARDTSMHAPGSEVDGPLGAGDLTTGERDRLRRAVAAHLRRPGSQFFVNKNTRNTRRVGYLAEAFPEARFVHIVRHPVATAASTVRVAFFPDLLAFWRDGRTMRELVAEGETSELLAAELWHRETASCHDALTRIPEDRKLELRYEDLAAQPLPLLERVMELVGREVSDSMRSQVRARGIATRNERAFNEMPGSLRRHIWDVTGDLASGYGYDSI